MILAIKKFEICSLIMLHILSQDKSIENCKKNGQLFQLFRLQSTLTEILQFLGMYSNH